MGEIDESADASRGDAAGAAEPPVQAGFSYQCPVQFTVAGGLHGWLQGRAKKRPCYGHGAIELTPTVLTLRGKQRTWLGMEADAEILVSAASIRNVAREGARVSFECRLGRKWRTVEFMAPADTDAATTCGLLPETTTTGFATQWEELREFNRVYEALPTRALVTTSLVIANLVMFIVLVLSNDRSLLLDVQQLVYWGGNSGLYTLHGEWWRLFTALFLHVSVLHLGFNLWALWNFGRLTERLYGSWTYLGIYVGTGLLASLASTAWLPNATGVGASGAIFGVLGAFLAFLLRKDSRAPIALLRTHRVGTIVFIAFSLLNGAMQPLVDNAAHLGGLVSGFLLGWLLAPTWEEPRPRPATASRAVLASAIVLGCIAGGAALLHANNPDPSGIYAFSREHRWYLPEESRRLRSWQQLGYRLQAGNISNQAFVELFRDEQVPFWTSASKRLGPVPVDGDPADATFVDLVREFVALRRDWAQALVDGLDSEDEAQLKKSAEYLRASNLLQPRLDHAILRWQIDELPRGLRSRLVARFRAWTANRPGACVRSPYPGSTPAASDDRADGPAALDRAGCEAQRLFLSGDYRALDMALRQHAARLADLPDGSSTLSGMAWGLDDLFNFGPLQLYEAAERLSDWRRATPRSGEPFIAEAVMYKNWAWAARGSGGRDTVSGQAWELFRHRIEMAAIALQGLGDRGPEYPEWHVTALNLALVHDESLADMRKRFDEGAARFPQYLPIHRAMLRILMPRWRGSVEEIDRFITEVADRAHDKDATYARLYWMYAQLEREDKNIFEATPASWTRIEDGFNELMQRYPDSDFLVNAFASLACQANDLGAFAILRPHVELRPSGSAWWDPKLLANCMVRSQVRAALDAAEPMKARITYYAEEQGRLPGEELTLSDAELQPRTLDGVSVRLGAGGAVAMQLVGGPMDGHRFSWVPTYRDQRLVWTCAQETVPEEYLLAPCR